MFIVSLTERILLVETRMKMEGSKIDEKMWTQFFL
jgi:hypothetical protein